MNQYEQRREARREREGSRLAVDLEWERDELSRMCAEMERDADRERLELLNPLEREAEKLGVSVDEMKCLKNLGGDDYKTLWFGSLA